MDTLWTCRKCGCGLKTQKVVFDYLGHSFSHELPRCPQCGKALITGELAEGKITEVETTLEDK
jgi:NAD-dependent SIR2 family protein deacetylase